MASDKKIVLVTGGNTGLGLEIVKALIKTSTPYELIIGCRDTSKGEAAIQSLSDTQTSSAMSTLQVDLESDASLEKAVETISSKYGHLDVLINNGGASFDVPIQDKSISIRDGFNKSWDVNVAGTHVLTTLAVPLLLKAKAPRLAFVTSGTSSIHETTIRDVLPFSRINAPPEAGWPKPAGPNPITSYRSSKAGLNMLMREWARILENDGVVVHCISPGFLATGLAGIGAEKLRKMGAQEPHIGGEFVRDVVEGKRDADVGTIVRNNGAVQPW